jgi:hypothetical protein
MTYLTSDWDFWELVWPQIFRGVGLMTAMIPINNVALGTLPPERVKNASGLFNLTRNLGGAVGLAGLTTILNDRTDLHLARLQERLTFASKPALETLDALGEQLQSHGSHGAQAAHADDPHPRPGHGLCRRLLPADAAVRGARSPRRHHQEAARPAWCLTGKAPNRYPKLIILALISLECQQPRSHISASSGISGGKP